MSSAEYRRKCIEYERRIAELEKYSKWGGWKGVGNRAIDGGIAVPCLNKSMPNQPDMFWLYKKDSWPSSIPPLAINEDAPHTVVEEARCYIAFGKDGGNNAIGVTWDYDAIILHIRPNSQIEYSIFAPDTAIIDPQSAVAPMLIMAYPILEPWIVRGLDTSIWPPEFALAWGSQPRTTFSDNLLGGAPSGHINPATNNIDNFLAYCHGCTVNYHPAALFPDNWPPSVSHILHSGSATSYSRASGHGMNLDSNGGASGETIEYDFNCFPDIMGNASYQHNGNKALFMRTANAPSGTIYGIALMLCTLGDLQALRLINPAVNYPFSLMLDPNWASFYPRQIMFYALSTIGHCAFTAGAEANYLNNALPDDDNNAQYFYQTDDAEMSEGGNKQYKKFASVGFSPTGQKILSLNLA